MSEPLYLDRLATPLGALLLVADAKGALRMLEFEDKPDRWRKAFARDKGRFEKRSDPFGIASLLKRYFAGDMAALQFIAAAPGGTPFQTSCWKLLRRIPAGTTTTYGTLAKTLGKPNAMRAVGLANGANPIAIVVPCHRVVGSDGSLTGYGGGLERKRWLLSHEARFSAQKRE